MFNGIDHVLHYLITFDWFQVANEVIEQLELKPEDVFLGQGKRS